MRLGGEYMPLVSQSLNVLLGYPNSYNFSLIYEQKINFKKFARVTVIKVPILLHGYCML